MTKNRLTIQSAFARNMGMILTEVGDGCVLVSMRVGDAVQNIYGYVHGGALASLADQAMGLSVVTILDPEHELSSTLELKINYLRPSREGMLYARGKVLRKGKATAFATATITDAAQVEIAFATATFFIQTINQPET